MFWTWLFVGLLVVGGGLVWQDEEMRRKLFRELQGARDALNELAGPYEAWQVMFVSVGATLIGVSLYSFLCREDKSLKSRIKATFFRLLRSFPPIRTKIEKEVNKTLRDVEKSMFPVRPGEKYRTQLPAKGLSQDKVLKEISDLEKHAGVEWQKGLVSGALYNCSQELTALTTEVFRKCAWTNPLHADLFPYIRKMEAEVVSWCVGIFNGGKDACGTMTSGGTESILMAMRVYRQLGYERGIHYPEIVCPLSAHCAFNKAAEYFHMKITHVPVDPCTRQVNMKAMARAISKNTVVLVGSAPHFPQRIIDPIEDIAKLAYKHGIGCHVDCCLGGFVVPFMEKAGFPIAPFDFRVRGVTSISADTHKYGCAPKGTSVILYSNKELKHRQYFVDPNWQGGMYATPTVAGSRPGCLIAATWATMLYIGMDGYVEATRKIVSTTRKITTGLKKIPGLYLLGAPKAFVVAFGSKDFDIYRLSDAMKDRGWNLNSLQFPSSIHLCVTLLHTQEGVADRFIRDTKECTAEIMKNPKAESTGSAAVYGMAQSIPDRSIITELACGFMDLYYKADPPSSAQ